MATTPHPPPDARPHRGGLKALLRLNLLATLALAGLVWAMVNFLSSRHYARGDWSQARFYQLSGKTLQLARTLEQALHIYAFFQPGHQEFADVQNLLKEYDAASPRIHVEMVDPDRDLARAEELARKYNLDQPNVVVFDFQGRHRVVRASDVVEYDFTPMNAGQAPIRTAFRGEQVFSSALHDLTQARRPTIYFTRGHGERDPENFDAVNGYSKIARLIQADNALIAPVDLGQVKAVPADCDLLVVAGPQKYFAPFEVGLVREYLERKGRLLLLLDALNGSGLEPLLQEWGVRLDADVVVDGTRTLSGRELYINQYGDHAITRRIKNLAAVFFLPRSVQPVESYKPGADPMDRPQVSVLAASSDSGWAEYDMEQNPMRYDPESDQPGPIPIAVAIERGPPPGLKVQIRPTRLVVFGDSDFGSNGGLMGVNADIFMNSVNWLMERDTLLDIAAKPYEQTHLLMDRRQLDHLFWSVVGGLPACVAVAGLLVWWRRRA